MDVSERASFIVLAKRLMLALDARAATDERVEAYWDALKPMALVAFTRLVESALGPNGEKWHGGKVPSTALLWQQWREQRYGHVRREQSETMQANAAPWDAWLLAANKMLLREIHRILMHEPGRMGAPSSPQMVKCVELLLQARNDWIAEMREHPERREPVKQRAYWREVMGAVIGTFPTLSA